MTDVLRLSLPLTVWLISFSSVYGLHGLVCATDWPRATDEMPLGRVALVGSWIVAVLVQAVVLYLLTTRRYGGENDFVRRVGIALGVVALVAVIWTLFPVAALPMCR